MRRFVAVLPLLVCVACGGSGDMFTHATDAPSTVVTTTAVVTTSTTTLAPPPACRSMLRDMDQFIVDQANRPGTSSPSLALVALCTGDTVPPACLDAAARIRAVAALFRDTSAKVAAYDAAVAAYRVAAAACLAKL